MSEWSPVYIIPVTILFVLGFAYILNTLKIRQWRKKRKPDNERSYLR